jgi:peptidoglycan hydrolase-like protein with peptidoglycan-binding domain
MGGYYRESLPAACKPTGERPTTNDPKKTEHIGADAAAGVGAQRAAILHPEFRESGVASKQQRLLGIRAGHGSVDAAFHLQHGCTRFRRVSTLSIARYRNWAQSTSLRSASSSVYHGMTVSLHKRMAGGMYFRLAYTWAHAIDSGQDALVAGAPATVQNSYSTKSERASSVTDQRQRLTISAIEEPNPFEAGPKVLAAMFNHWKISGIMTYGGRSPTNATVSGDPNQDGNTSNDRLSKYGRNARLGPDDHGSEGGKEDESGRTVSSGVDRGVLQFVQSRQSEVWSDRQRLL